MDLLALSFFLKRLISPNSFAPLSCLVLQPLCLRLVDDTSGGHTKVSRLVGRGFCEVSDFARGLRFFFFSVPVYLAQLSYVCRPRWACFQSRPVLPGVFDLPPLDLNGCLDFIEVIFPPGSFCTQLAAFPLMH